MASFRKRGNSWQYRVHYVDRRTGDKKEAVASGFTTKTEAKHAAAEMERKIKRGFDPGSANQTLSDYLDWWFETYKKGTTTHGTENNIKKHIKMLTDRIGYMDLNEIARPTYQKFINEIAKDYAKSTTQRMNATISEAFKEAMDLDLMHKNPASRVNYPKIERTKIKKKFLEMEDYLILIQHAQEDWGMLYPHYLYITHLLVATGARIGEICALGLSDIDLDKKSLNIDKTLVREKDKYVVKPTTKTGESGERIIGLDDFTLDKLREWTRIRSEWVMKLRNRPEFLFINPLGELIKMPNYADMLRTLCRRHELMHVTPHMFRHTHETILWESGIADINYIGARLGDTDKSILLNTYGHMSKRSEQLSNEKVNKFMSTWLEKIK
ncbi:tyrosine-type recombinase/integrase [Mesobacillus subterraneus]|uniref:tyrosine-type recombinase/integrase n=1 Tax=Mesobacillus subterraneus TaxID=285983 RepID=UPI00203E0D38|nr:tyrosine-type recombinase/integrase [Mesobacillus subterraneus]MCM3663489.1 tyrosine-type recombinase/integrase [Mesobacillus subterraneus]MCM3683259.1 tyrosine-type recombinase/integrase [Mesobacillus subterraneus]